MQQERWKLFLKALWGAVIALLVISLLAGAIGGSEFWNTMLAGSFFVIIQLAVLTLLFIIIVRLKEWIEGQVASMAGRKGADAELQALRQSLDRIEAKVDRIEKVLNEIPE
ncbi:MULTISPECIES: hypothetical protein [unclassified Methanoculleus]|jgi:hypothetical protein|uniref:hypothetical protein n=1 Tax=unclassified Methanoculleus TaxID=2619537 RepID=UPI0025FFAC6E|nr:hypothetical protein [Methanoculleus sp. UBA377]